MGRAKMDGARMSELEWHYSHHLGLLFILYKYSSGFTQLIVGDTLLDVAKESENSLHE